MMLAAIRIAFVLLAAVAVQGVSYVQAQGRGATPSQVPRYAPSSPTVSPYLNLLNRNGDTISNYYGLVRPLQRQQSLYEAQQRALQNQGQLIGNQEQQINRIRNDQEAFSQPKVKSTGTAGWFQNQGSRPSYQVADHYYGQWEGARKGRRGGR